MITAYNNYCTIYCCALAVSCKWTFWVTLISHFKLINIFQTLWIPVVQTSWYHKEGSGLFPVSLLLLRFLWPLFYPTLWRHTCTEHTHTPCRSPIFCAAPRSEWVGFTCNVWCAHTVGVDWSVEKSSPHCLFRIRISVQSGWHGPGSKIRVLGNDKTQVWSKICNVLPDVFHYLFFCGTREDW